MIRSHCVVEVPDNIRSNALTNFKSVLVMLHFEPCRPVRANGRMVLTRIQNCESMYRSVFGRPAVWMSGRICELNVGLFSEAMVTS